MVHRRSGVSELVAAVLTIAITLIAGAALFGYVNGQAADSENAQGQRNAANINYINEREVITLVKFQSGSQANVWVYNTGTIALASFTILISGYVVQGSNPSAYMTLSCSSNGTCSPCGTLIGPTSIAVQSPPQFYLIDATSGGCTFQSGTFTFTFQGQFGSTTSTTKGF